MTIDTGSQLQRDPAGRLRHLLTLDGLSRDELLQLLDQELVDAAGRDHDKDLEGFAIGVAAAVA